jgi:SnoaL-like domain
MRHKDSISGMEQVEALHRTRPRAILAAMSEENLATTRRAIEAGNRNDIDGIMAEYGPDPVMRMPLEGPNPGTHRGRKAIRRFFEDFYGEWVEFVIDIDDLIDLDDRVIGSSIGGGSGA